MPTNIASPIRNISNIDDLRSLQPDPPKQEMDKDAFLQLMITQLTNQDPTNPMDNSQMLAQSAQFSQLEQLTNMTDAIGKMVSMYEESMSFNAASYIGLETRVSGGNQVSIIGGQTENIEFKLPNDADGGVFITLYGPEGDYIDRLEVGALSKGNQSVAWDAHDAAGNVLPDGMYQFSIGAYDSDDMPMEGVETFSFGPITAVRNEDGRSIFQVNGQEYTLSELDSFYMPRSFAGDPQQGQQPPQQQPPTGGEEGYEDDAYEDETDMT
ncbi:flagellar hook assembly protein FlgD [Desulfurispira natronophila]|uniref:Basal-body rod modification protein FlgD n=1 Tax=Desulfurispira natronophila TaxID=682562 RepID=A0A7W8DH39_9BACT|nr:flagellar hook capping FlgD N-terminal domain-containing protein [Desulfurispira natronophila]MBB5022171.1 flagellar basal-body rod modification protein FlgD [Desulfurispira natronophila]